MTTLDTTKMFALLDIAVDITGVQVPAFYRAHGAGAEQERNVIGMMNAALDCMERATELAAAHPPTYAAMAKRVQVMRDQIAEHQAEYAAWLEVPLWVAMAEGEGQTKH